MKLKQSLIGNSLIGLFLAVFCLAPHVCSAQERIAFASTRDHYTNEIYTMNPDGSDVKRLTFNTIYDYQPSISRDGRKIVFVSGESLLDIYAMNSDGSSRTRLTYDQSSNPKFSPDGTKIVYECLRDVGGAGLFREICVMNADGSNQTRVTTDSINFILQESSPSFSPDGTKIVFHATDTFIDIYQINADGSNRINLTNGSGSRYSYNPSYSPDGSKIIFTSTVINFAFPGINIMNSDGSGRVRLSGNTQNADPGVFSPNGRKIVYTSAGDLFTMDIDGTNQINVTPSTGSIEREPSWGGFPRRPVMIIPGIAGTYAASINFDQTWLLNRGVAPAGLQIDPIARVYDDLIKTFENLGYVRNKDLFVVNYDWRVLPGPRDSAIDGVVDGITATSISDQQFKYGVDYLGLALRKAYQQWELDHPGQKLDEVDIVAHSTGGLVARTYIQSAAYNAEFAIDKKLPKVKNMIMVGVPNRGASKAWNPLNDDWNVEDAYRFVLSKIVDRAYQKVLTGCGGGGCTIPGPDHDITKASISNSQGPSHTMFIDQYVPTMRALLATYDFIDFGNGYTNLNGDPVFSNDWVLDLNNGLDFMSTPDPNPFANSCTPTIIYASNQQTPTFVKQILTGGTDQVLNFDDYAPDDVPVGVPWFMDIDPLNGGDGTVPVRSAIGQFIGDNRVTLKEITAGDPDHTGLMSNLEAQKAILQTIGTTFQDSNISTVLARNNYSIALSVTLDPVDGFVVDGAGRRLGFSESTGPITEIPGSIWVGDSDGMGWVFGPVEGPLRLELTGRGEPYYVIVSVETEEGNGGVTDSGFLSSGATRTLPIIIGETPDTTPPIIAPNITGTVGNNSWYTSDVGISWTVTDAESDVSSQTGCGAQPVTADTVGMTFTCSATSGGGSSTQSITIKRDATAPSLSPVVAPNPIGVNGSAVATPNAFDATSGIASQICDPVNTSTTGSFTVNCVATDSAGNSGQAAVGYSVTGFQFTGFFQPVDNLPILNAAKAGASIPVRFSLNGNQGLDIFAPGHPASAAVPCGTSSVTSTIEETVNAGGSSLTYDAAADRYAYVWKTSASWKGSCRILIVRFRDGSTYYASFGFR
jgi:hypothetical protein